MLNSTQKHIPIPNSLEKGFVSALAVGTAIGIDQFLGTRGNAARRTVPEFHTTRLDENTPYALGVLPGCQTNGRLFFESLIPLTPDTKLITTDYPEHRFNIEAVCEGLAKQLVQNRIERPALLCESMGGIVMRHFLHYADQMGVAEKLGGFSAVVLDSSPFDYDDVRESSKRLATAASATGIRTSHTFDFLKRHIYGHFAGHMSADAHLDTIRSETLFMQQQHPDGPLPDIMDSIYYIHGPFDHVINTDTAAPRYQAIAPSGKFQEIVHESRRHGDHTASITQLDFVLSYAGVAAPNYSLVA